MSNYIIDYLAGNTGFGMEKEAGIFDALAKKITSLVGKGSKKPVSFTRHDFPKVREDGRRHWSPWSHEYGDTSILNHGRYTDKYVKLGRDTVRKEIQELRDRMVSAAKDPSASRYADRQRRYLVERAIPSYRRTLREYIKTEKEYNAALNRLKQRTAGISTPEEAKGFLSYVRSNNPSYTLLGASGVNPSTLTTAMSDDIARAINKVKSTPPMISGNGASMVSLSEKQTSLESMLSRLLRS